jgi:hypothetical protein
MPQTDTETTTVWGIPILFEIKLRAYRYNVFCSGRHMIETCPNLSCLTAEIRFFAVSRAGAAGSIKKVFRKCGNVEEYKAYRLIPPMSILFNSWTIPLRSLLHRVAHDTVFESTQSEVIVNSGRGSHTPCFFLDSASVSGSIRDKFFRIPDPEPHIIQRA